MKKKTFILQPANLLRNLESQSAIWIKKNLTIIFLLSLLFPTDLWLYLIFLFYMRLGLFNFHELKRNCDSLKHAIKINIRSYRIPIIDRYVINTVSFSEACDKDISLVILMNTTGYHLYLSTPSSPLIYRRTKWILHW